MAEQPQITLEEALKLVEFQYIAGTWLIKHVHDNVWGSVDGDVGGSVYGDVGGSVYGTINGRKWKVISDLQKALHPTTQEGKQTADSAPWLDTTYDGFKHR